MSTTNQIDIILSELSESAVEDITETFLDNKDRPLWSDGKSLKTVELAAGIDPSAVVFYLYEDLLCLREDLREARDKVAYLEMQKNMLY